jgi:hypothetical protein
MATTRKAISKKTRFEIFKRDGFVCQYCGAHPPSVILHVDHINPVALGGKNDPDNLITACEPCNLGKAARSLADVPKSLKQKAAETAEREEQIRGYQAVMDAKRSRIQDDIDRVCEVYERFNPGYTLSDSGAVTVRKFIEELGVHEVIDAMESAYTRPSVRRNGEFRYFCGICWNKIRKNEDER